MRFRTTFAMVLALAFAQPLCAAQKEDIAYLETMILTEEWLKPVRSAYARIYAKSYIRYLGSKSVSILDQETVEGTIPDYVTDPWIALHKKRVVGCLWRMPSEKTKMAAKYVRTMAFREQDSVRPEIRASDPELSLDQWIGELQESIDTFDTPGFAKAVQVAFCGGLGSPLYDEVKKASEVRQGNDISFLAAILEIPGVARFPNRIIRKDILSDLRETSKYATH